MDRKFYKRWHAHPFRETLRYAALGHEIEDDDLPEADGHVWTQLRTACDYLYERAGEVGNVGKPKLAAEADRISALIVSGATDIPLVDPDDEGPPPGELADAVRKRERGW